MIIGQFYQFQTDCLSLSSLLPSEHTLLQPATQKPSHIEELLPSNEMPGIRFPMVRISIRLTERSTFQWQNQSWGEQVFWKNL